MLYTRDLSLLSQPRYFCHSYCAKILSAAFYLQSTEPSRTLHADPDLQSQVRSPGPWPPAPSPSFLGKVTDWKLVALGGLCGGGPSATHHVMLQDSLDHGGEHFDDHHGPGPLSAVLGRQQGTVRAEPGRVQLGPPEALTTVCGGGGGPSSAAWDPLLHTAVWLSVPFGESKRSG